MVCVPTYMIDWQIINYLQLSVQLSTHRLVKCQFNQFRHKTFQIVFLTNSNTLVLAETKQYWENRKRDKN